MVVYLNQRLFRHFDLHIQFVLDFRTKGHAVLDFLDKVRNDDEFANIRSKRQYVYSALLSFLLLYTYKTHKQHFDVSSKYIYLTDLS